MKKDNPLRRAAIKGQRMKLLAEAVFNFPVIDRFEIEDLKRFITVLVKIDDDRDKIRRQLVSLTRHPDSSIAMAATHAIDELEQFMEKRSNLSLVLRGLMQQSGVNSPD